MNTHGHPESAQPSAEIPKVSDLQRGRISARFASRSAAGSASGDTPLLAGPEGIRFDFNYGCRVQVPVAGWRVRMHDLDTQNLIFDAVLAQGEIAASRRKYFVRFLLEVFDGERRVFSHTFDAQGRRVWMTLGSGALGDAIAWVPAIEAFRQRYGGEVTVEMKPWLHALFQEGYPALRFVSESPQQDHENGEPVYATYGVGCYSPYTDRDHQPTDPRVSSLQDFASYMLGVPAVERRTNIVVADRVRKVPEPYVCIAVQASAQCKYWNNPDGWRTLVAHLKSRGYRVLCIDRDREYGLPGALNTMPEGAEDFTGELPLQERASLLMHADFFVGLGSGLSWLAWAVGVPVALISGFSHPNAEFRTPWRIINFHACNSCYNDLAFEFGGDFEWCPRHANDAMRYQCTKAITPGHVIRVVDDLIASRWDRNGTAMCPR
ncbi:MAG TPA: autotransporter strand-loop-strand O-heptosyltransferase [Paraburkholderia sp.]|jgi:autotransporter strand-loop-strand O-heptosyltransferase|uniref:autotransporter strand-loop-strand O-heptosyltransferase n=1 Tax=Paraburkholderia sp. TaxID=1926495 RepID=UPI002DF01911|nr:autotransporter strand-loop-strand O-heptosyltransferase [Paraburkholderia sp.]